MLEGLLLGLFGFFLLIVAIFDIEWFMNLTKAARRGYPLGKNLTRGLIGFGGLMMLLFALGSL